MLGRNASGGAKGGLCCRKIVRTTNESNVRRIRALKTSTWRPSLFMVYSYGISYCTTVVLAVKDKGHLV